MDLKNVIVVFVEVQRIFNTILQHVKIEALEIESLSTWDLDVFEKMH